MVTDNYWLIMQLMVNNCNISYLVNSRTDMQWLLMRFGFEPKCKALAQHVDGFATVCSVYEPAGTPADTSVH